ncbi:AMP-binding protein, partial [Methylomonas rivi]
RSHQAIVAMLAVLKAGGAYLPLDPEQPGERLAELMADAGVKRAISLSSLVMAPSGATAGLRPRPVQPTRAADAVDGCVWLNLDETDLSAYPATAPVVTLHPEQLAYLILTSGSTGQPKSVAVAHGALSRHIQAAGELYAYTRHDRALHFAAFTFDAAMEQWLAPLCHGAGVVLGFGGWTGD